MVSVEDARAGEVSEGVLQCPHDDCLSEFPIVDGIPVLVPAASTFLAENLLQVIARDDLSEVIEDLLGECSGPGSLFDSLRLQLSSYGWDHYGEFDAAESSSPKPGSIGRVFNRGRELCTGFTGGPSLDIGCSAGRASFELAEASGELVLGVDTNLTSLRLARRVASDGIVRYPRRRGGLLYERRSFPVTFKNRELVDFWACDATALPFPTDRFANCVSLNVIDCVPSPLDHLREIVRTLASDGHLVVSTPHDWTGSVTAPPSWVGGHSKRAAGAGASEPVLRSLLSGEHAVSVKGLEIIAEDLDVPWQVRVHDRHSAQYRLQMIVATSR